MANRGIETSRLAVIAGLAGVSWLLALAPARGQANAPTLKLLITMGQQFVAEPDAARIVLHIHNPTQQTLWLYRRAKGKKPPEERVSDENRPPETAGGSTVEVKLQPVDAKAAQAASSPAVGTVLEYVNMPKPRLVKLAAGGDYEETSIVHMQPAQAEGEKPIWGAYQLAVVYGASFSNAEEFQRNLGATLWQGEVTSNTISVDLRPPLPDSVGVVSGTSLGPDLQPRAGIRVSLSDEQGQLTDQQVTEGDGRFSFAHLPLVLYWVTGRREAAKEDTVTFRHEELTSAAPSVNTQLVLYPPEIYEAKKLVHKPALLRVFDPGGQPVAGIELEAVFSNGDVVDDVKGTTGDDGMAAMELLPGRSSVSLKRRGCAEQVDRADVAPGGGADSFKLVFDCVKK
ncbi:MAG: carboxypeptidase-like regulatory domain-containing protein [Terriglobia bacterium]|jgi:hypothetical protein